MHTYMLKELTARNTAADAGHVKIINKKVTFKNFAPFTNCINEINYTQIDDAPDIDIVMPMYNLMEYSDVHSKISRSWQYYRYEPALDNNNNTFDFPAHNNNSFKFVQI